MKPGAVEAMPIYVWPCALITARTVEVLAFDRSLFLLCERMAKTLEATASVRGGGALASTQIGDTRRVVMVRVGGGFLTLINPAVIDEREPVSEPEHDLSFPAAAVDVTRSSKVFVEYSGLVGERLTAHLEGQAARDAARGIDYLNGRTLFDHAGWFKRRALRSKYKKALKMRFPTRVDHLPRSTVSTLTGGGT